MPRIVWQPAHGLREERRRGRAAARRVDGARAGALLFASQARNARRRLGDDLDRHVRVLEAAELRALAAVDARPGRRSSRMRFSRPGIMSIFRFSSGTQKLWITSAVVATTSTRVSTGMWISFAVTTPVPG